MLSTTGTRYGARSSPSRSVSSARTSWGSSRPPARAGSTPTSRSSGPSFHSPFTPQRIIDPHGRRLYDLFEAIQTHGGPGARAAVFFAATAFFLSQLSVTVVACGTVGGIDLAALLPRFLDIRRGSFVVAAVGILINPWKILNVSNSLLAGFASGSPK